MSEMAWSIPILIFLARICDVSIGTVRTILVLGGYRISSALLGAVEVCIWVLAVGGAIRYLPNPWALLGYAGGFATGVLVGMTIEEKLALGYRMVRIITPRKWKGDADESFVTEDTPHPEGLAAALRGHGFRAMRIEGEGPDGGPVWIIFCAVARRRLNQLQEVVAEAAPGAYFTVERLERAHDPGATAIESRFARRVGVRPFSVRK
ncbi:MAG: DUF2179 domain-containing protein [Phycisphaerales bacterium JB039]